MRTIENTPSRQTLESIPERALAFLRGVGIYAPIRENLAAHGYTATDHREGWALLHKVAGFVADSDTLATESDTTVRDAILELDRWDESGFRRAHAALSRRHPEQDAFVFENLEPSQGTAAVLGVATFLDRLDALEKSAQRKATRKADHAALATLAQRGIDEKERARLRGLVDAAQSSADVPGTTPEKAERQAQRTRDLLELRAWYIDWSETTRAVITRRDHLIRLGLAKRKSKKDAAPEPTPSV